MLYDYNGITLPDFAHELMEALGGGEIEEFFCERAYANFTGRFGTELTQDELDAYIAGLLDARLILATL